MKKLLTMAVAALLMAPLSTQAQRYTDKIDRGLVVVPASTSGNLISWRVMGEEYYDVTYNLYKDGQLLAENLTLSNYNDKSGTASNSYQVEAVVRGVKQTKSAAVKQWSGGMLSIPVQPVYGRDGKDVTSYYTINDISIGDLDGDGVVEFICKRPCSVASDVTQKNCFHVLDCYDRTGKRLWWIDLGPNMLAGADEQWDAVCYDWDQDGKAEVLMRIEDNAIIHYADGTADTIGSSTVDTRWSGIEYTSTGNEYLLYLEGATGKPYEIGPSSHPKYMTYPNPRGQDSDWGTGIVGHRSTKHYFGAPFLDGRHPSIFLGRGCYTKHMMKAFDVDPITHALTQRWAWNCSTSGPWMGQGYHNFAVGDVDWDGRDEIIFGSMVIDDNGMGLSTTGLGHGDAQHCSDFDPYRKGEEQFACNETSPAMNYRNATTSEIYYRKEASGDDGRALMGNFTNDYPGAVGRSVGTGWIGACADKIIDELGGDSFISWGDLNQRIYWDGDLLDEYFDSPGTEGYGVIYKPASNTTSGGRWNFPDSKCSNWSKNNPGGIADIFGDWREELIMRKSDNTAILVYSTGIPTNYRIPTLWSDHQYRNAMVWQSMGYNQPPHKSYFLGEMEGITQAPPTNTMTGRTEVSNGGTIKTCDDHLIVCETNDTKVSIQDGAAPYMVTFNVPSHVEGTAPSECTTKSTKINYTYYTCDVTGGALTGTMRLVKQGDGILNLPKVNMTYTGETNIWNGTLNFDGTMKNSPMWLNRFAELNSNGGEFKSIRADYGAVIRPGGADKIGNITVDKCLRLGFGARLLLDVDSTSQTIDGISCDSLVIETKSWKYGPKYLMPVIELTGKIGAGKYLIGNVNKMTGSLVNIKVEGTGKYKYAFTLEEGKLYITLSSVRGAARTVWTGKKSDTWDYASTENFYLADDATKTPDVFVSGDQVTFSDEAANKNVTVKSDMTVDTMFVNNTSAYTFSGTGKIVGGAFVKEGSGTVTMSNDNTYKGGNFLRGGTTIVSSLASSTQAYGGLGAVQSDAMHFIIENGAELQTTGEVQNGSFIRLRGDEGGIINNTAGFTQQKTFMGTLLTKKGAGWMTMSSDNSSLTKLIIQAGGVGAVTTPAKTVEIQGGTLNLAPAQYGTTSCAIIVPQGKTATINYNTPYSTCSNTLTGAGTVTISYPSVKGSTYYAMRASLNGNWSAFEGTVKPTAMYTADGRFVLNNNYGLAKGTMDIASGIYVCSTAKTYAIGALTGAGSLSGTESISSSAVSGNATWNVGGKNTNFTFAGTVVNNAIFNKVGTGIMTASGAWTNTGGVNIKEGTIKISTATKLGTGALTVADGAMLTGSCGTTVSSTGTLTNSAFTINGTVRPGATATYPSGCIAFNGKSVTIGSTGVLRIGATKKSTSPKTMSGSFLKNISTLKLDGTISIYMYNTYTPAVGDTIRFCYNVATITGTPAIQCDGDSIEFDTSSLTKGVLIVKKIIHTAVKSIPADDPVNVEVYSIDGQKLMSFSGQYSQVNGIFRSQPLPRGTYLLRIKSAEATITEKKLKN